MTPGIISRGYRGKGSTPVMVESSSDPLLVGDEPLLIRHATNLPVAVCQKRFDAAKMLLAQFPKTDVIISDDGLQHHALARDVELAVVGARGLGNGWILPAGPLREPPTRLNSVDAIVLNATKDIISSPKPRYAATSSLMDAIHYASGDAISLHTLSRKQAKKQLVAEAMAGIAVPGRFFAMLRAHGLTIKEHALPDHYSFSKNPFAESLADLIFITEKDAVKCQKFPELSKDERIFIVPLETKLDKFLVDLVERKIKDKSHGS